MRLVDYEGAPVEIPIGVDYAERWDVHPPQRMDRNEAINRGNTKLLLLKMGGFHPPGIGRF